MSMDGNLLNGRAPVVRRICPVFFLLDCSGSMTGKPIGMVNDAMEGVLPKLASMNESNANIEIKLAVLKFETIAEWVTGDNGLVDADGYSWTYLDTGCTTAMGEAFDKLNSALSAKHGFLRRASGSVAPVLFLLTDGYATDNAEEALKRLESNNWYKLAVRIAVGLGNYDRELLLKFTKNEEAIFEVSDPNTLASMIKFVSITSSMVASRGSDASDGSGDADNNTKKAAKEIRGLLNPDGSGGSISVPYADPDDPDGDW